MYNFIHVHVNMIYSFCNCPFARHTYITSDLLFCCWWYFTFFHCLLYSLNLPPLLSLSLFLIFLLGVYRHRPAGVDGQWQRPEISSNLGEDLSLADPIDPNLLPQQQERRSQRWKDAHCKSCCYDNTMHTFTCTYSEVHVFSSPCGQRVIVFSFTLIMVQ